MRIAALVAALCALAGTSSCAAPEGRGRRVAAPDREAAPEGVRRGDRAPRSEPDGDADLYGDRPVGAPSRQLDLGRFETVAIGPPPAPPAEPRPRARRNVRIELNGAPFDDVARMLADVGGFGVVVEAPGAGRVQASLRDVDAWDALVTICETKGLEIRYERGIAVILPPGAAARSP
jgi:hypothetical protein